MAKLTDVPLEILREIAHNIDAGDISTIKAASLVCQKLTPVFQERIFAEVYLHETERDEFREFYSIAMNSTHVLAYTWTFTIVILSKYDEDLLIHVLSHGSSIRKLYIKEIYCGYAPEAMDNRHTFCSRLSSAISKPPLAEIHLDRLNYIPLSFLKQCRKLKYLNLIDSSAYHKIPPLEPEEEQTKLDTLQISSKYHPMEHIAAWLLHPRCMFDIRNVKTLYLTTITYADRFHIWNIMKQCAHTVETMHVYLMPSITDNNGNMPIVDFSIFPNLHTLHFRASMADPDDEIDVTIKHAFRNVAKGTPIRTILLDLTIEELDIQSWDQLRWIYEVFAFSDAFTDGQRVVVTFFHCRYQAEQKIIEYFKSEKLLRIKHIKLRFCEEEQGFEPFRHFLENGEI